MGVHPGSGCLGKGKVKQSSGGRRYYFDEILTPDTNPNRTIKIKPTTELPFQYSELKFRSGGDERDPSFVGPVGPEDPEVERPC